MLAEQKGKGWPCSWGGLCGLLVLSCSLFLFLLFLPVLGLVQISQGSRKILANRLLPSRKTIIAYTTYTISSLQSLILTPT